MRVFLQTLLVSLFFLQVATLECRQDQLSALISRNLNLPTKNINSVVPLSIEASIFEPIGANLLFVVPGISLNELDQIDDTLLYVPVRGVPNLSPLLGAATNDFRATIADVLCQHKKGSALIITQASSLAGLKSLSISMSTSVKSPSNDYSFANYWDEDTQEFVFLYYTTHLISGMNKARVIELLSRPETLSNLLGNEYTVRSQFEGDFSVTLLKGDESIEASFDLDDGSDLLFFAEILAMVSSIQAAVGNQKLIRDTTSDYYAFAFESISKIEEEYGRFSNEYLVAIALLKGAVRYARETLSNAYEENGLLVASQVVVTLSGPTAVRTRSLEQIQEEEEVYHANYDTYTDSDTTDTAIFDFQIILWTVVLLLVTIISSVLTMVYMDTGADTLLYRTALDIQLAQQQRDY